MKYFLVVTLLLVSSAATTGCVSGPYARQGATMGALIGAPVGAVIGSRNGETGAGALIGGALGTLAGSNIGAGVDADQRAFQQQQRIRSSRLAIQDIVSMSQTGLGEDVIVTQIRSQGMQRAITTNDLIALKQAGVSDRVIQTMQTADYSGTADWAPPPRRNGPVIIEEHYWDSPDCVPFYGPYPPRHFRPHRPIRPGRRASFTFSQRF